ncbi:hypothetical protein HNR40_004275 [Nonomuraea endophytica]|uniref:Uncharacterized protein n=1 Tax=Nonomuraea endophytica TaxID=714136 RepID=A0A7W8EGN7_9ACTN|nr:hypothetical protein [Nonomuraea endophytica]
MRAGHISGDAVEQARQAELEEGVEVERAGWDPGEERLR